ncbi:RHS repeat domain-containing protein, partial [Aeromonas veronii]|uniref:RHS repeat domain-containing protein n=1 Tax=Aeromonas veronii TaxID=654 RepID=UPI00207C55B0
RYDPLDRLLEVRGELTERFLHDPAGNLLSQTLGGQFEGARTQGNRLLLSGDRHFEYDEFGRLAIERRGKGQSLVTHYHYDCQHQLVRAELPDGTTANYDYDAFGRRIRKTVSGAKGELVTEFLWQANNLIAENSYQLGDDKRRTDEQYRSFIYEPGSFKPLVQLEGEGQDAEVFHYQLDHLGTPLALTRDNGATAWQVRYRAYGNVWREDIAEVATPLRFQGQYFDAESGLHYNRHRYYQPETGRFITPDPIGLAGGLNNYQYAPNPIGWVDPLGLSNVPGQCPDADNRIGKVWDVGSYSDQRSSVIGQNLGLDAHHVGQKAIMKDLIEGYDPKTAPSILVPKVGHTVAKENVGVVSRSMNNSTTGKPFDSARDVVARDIKELRRVYPDVPNDQLRKLIELNKSMYIEIRFKK